MRAWNQLRPERSDPLRVEQIQRARKRGTRAKGKRTAVLRLEGLGPDGSAVIAKRTHIEKAALERTIYEEILRHFPATSLRYYGCVEEEVGESCWLFLEDAGGDPCTFSTEEQRVLAARWLGLLHLTASQVKLDALVPPRGPEFYLEELRSTREAIRGNQRNPVLTSEDRVVLDTILSHYDFIESRWVSIRELCASMPQTLVHGHLEKRNLRLRATPRGPVLLVFDWETASVGTPAIDLAQWMRESDSQPSAEYLSTVHTHWPTLTVGGLHQLANIGSLFRVIRSIGGAHYGLGYDEWSNQSQQLAIDYARWCMHDLRDFQTRLDQRVEYVRSYVA